MNTFIALLRGINVSGHNIIKMDVLCKLFEGIGFKNIQTYIQSGNVFFDTTKNNPAELAFIIKQEIFKVLGLEVPVVIIEKKDLIACFENNIFLKIPELDLKKLYVAFLSRSLENSHINNLSISNFKPDQASIDKNKIFIKYEHGAGKTKLNQNYIEKKLNLTATIRNWNTITQLLKISNERE